MGVKPPLRVVDVGCGTGRNAVYLAKLGFEVYAMDYVPFAVARTRKLAEKQGVSGRVHAITHAIDVRWPFKDDFFDLAIDNFSSIDIESRKGREKCRDEMLRTLKPEGYALVTAVSADDELEKTFPAGPEKNSVIWPENKKFQKNYEEKELRNFYGKFEVVKLRKVSKKTFKLGRHYTATNYWLVLKKV